MEGTTYIFLDESGDLGFDFSKRKTSRFFIVAIILTHDRRLIQQAVKKIHKELVRAYRSNPNVLHATSERPKVVLQFLKLLSKIDCKIFVMSIDKLKFGLQTVPKELYTMLVLHILQNLCATTRFGTKDVVEIYASRRDTNKFMIAHFLNAITLRIRGHDKRFVMSVRNPSDEKGLQAADFVSWAVFQKLEYGNSDYYSEIEHLIVSHVLLKNDKALRAL
ncbi:MAG: hypothetical protein A3C15_00710 [Candidatus Magasanikbacteria bacterium RIFCSPHIGHO2_02_FULL_50_9b]|uniref:DUF3800 domain-containing protein n=1 Tax=Candidatus Magasanikbacteria bacterium RIFCSPHIGHO2_02_FULL_50_9b TaxID=1798682 RepID=A0A1F6M8A0_9BACT|nr:MAG: hypothetical protein A3C15_00710 [Candidatus Magasanikbacteria bacterium RIFCSPHIGHO2_02_FULL_50_9b]